MICSKFLLSVETQHIISINLTSVSTALDMTRSTALDTTFSTLTKSEFDVASSAVEMPPNK